MRKMFVDIKEILQNPDLYYAHSKKDENNELQYETLTEHTNLCRYYFDRICKSKQIEQKMNRFYQVYMEETLGEASEEAQDLFGAMWRNVVAFHDLGKINPFFQRDILQRKDIDGNKAYNVIGSKHATLSSVLYMDYYLDKTEKLKNQEEAGRLLILIMCNGYMISRHHSKLVALEDFLTGQQREELLKAIKVMEKEHGKVCQKEFTLDEDCIKMMGCFFKDVVQSKKQSIWLYLYTKLLYSILVAADYYATSEYTSGVKILDLGELEDISELYGIFQNTEINMSIRAYENTTYPMPEAELQRITDINVLRKELFLDVERRLLANYGKDIFYLEAPTGSGKSNLSMNLSFQLTLKDKELKKIYYIYPFNTLLEQNQEIMERTFGNSPRIMERIAVVNSITPIKQVTAERKKEEDVENGTYYEYALLNRQFLNYPMILTTHVSIFDTIFGDSKESAFGFHQLAGSILVLDEIQSYKNEIWGEIITFLTEAAEFLHMKIIIMSATLPNLDELKEQSEQTVYLVQNQSKFFRHPCFKDRVKISRELLEKKITMNALLGHVMKQCGKGKKILIEFIRKGSAEEFYQKLIEEDGITETVLCMTGSDSILERKQIIKRIKKEAGVILVSTQVIEAGVDIDMDIGYKAIAKMDSEEQFMGRINRSNTEGRSGIVYFFQMDEPKKIYGRDIRVNQEFSIIREEIWECLKNKNFAAYYEMILGVWKKNYGKNSEADVYADMVRMLDFDKVKKKMQLISEDNWNVSVYLGRIITDEQGNEIDGKEIWETYKKLLYDNEMNYAKRKVKLSEVISKMNYFIYQVQQVDCAYDEQIGELFYIENGEEYIENGKLNRAKIVGQLTEFI